MEKKECHFVTLCSFLISQRTLHVRNKLLREILFAFNFELFHVMWSLMHGGIVVIIKKNCEASRPIPFFRFLSSASEHLVWNLFIPLEESYACFRLMYHRLLCGAIYNSCKVSQIARRSFVCFCHFCHIVCIENVRESITIQF